MDQTPERCIRWSQGCRASVTGQLAVSVPNANWPAHPGARPWLKEMPATSFCAHHGLEMLACGLVDGCKVRVIGLDGRQIGETFTAADLLADAFEVACPTGQVSYFTGSPEHWRQTLVARPAGLLIGEVVGKALAGA